MNAAPGWYDAGVPGSLRWWDGAQWTPYLAPVPDSAEVPTRPSLGWYATAAGRIRWWDGSQWTSLRVKDAQPGSDWANADQFGAAWVLGLLYLFIGWQQLFSGWSGPTPGTGWVFLLLGALWLTAAARITLIRRTPAPTADQLVVIDAVRPLPGEVEGPGAGWYPIGTSRTRWWTGARWSAYVGTAGGVRATFRGERAYRRYLILSWVIAGVGALIVITSGALLLSGGAGDGYGAKTALASGLLVGAIGGVLLACSGFQRRAVLLPTRPPAN